METIRIKFTGNVQKDLQNHFVGRSGVGYHTQKWSGGHIYDYTPECAVKIGQEPDRYEGYVQVFLDCWFMAEETAKAINEKTLQIGDYITLQTKAPDNIENKWDGSMEDQYSGINSL